ncbi:hypothetical protein DVH24_017788, partial [Malus domestica]
RRTLKLPVQLVNHDKRTLPIKSSFQKHEENIRKERVKQWREALYEAANLSGHDLKNENRLHTRQWVWWVSGLGTGGQSCREADFVRSVQTCSKKRMEQLSPWWPSLSRAWISAEQKEKKTRREEEGKGELARGNNGGSRRL